MTGRIRGFDGLRALAVLAVFLGHRSPLHGRQIAHVGVLLFFALSGYLIVGILHRSRQKIEARGSSVGAEWRRFMARRTRRVFPVYYAVLGALAAIALFGRPVAGWLWTGLPWHLAYLSNLYEGWAVGWQGSLSHLWSLSVEEQFYLVSAPLLLLLPSRWHMQACTALVMLGLISHVALVVSGASAVAIYTDSLTNGAYIALGGLLRLLAGAGYARNAGRLLLPLGAVLAALALFPDPLWAGGWMLTTPYLAGLAVLVVAQAPESRVVGLLEWRPLVYMGNVSYGFYLVHNLFWLPTPWHGPVGVLATMALNFALSFTLAALSWELFEKPILDGRWPWEPTRRELAAA